jgi:hypothetical protein
MRKKLSYIVSFVVDFVFILICRLTTEAKGIWRFAGAFAVVERQGELQISEANAGAKLAICMSSSL